MGRAAVPPFSAASPEVVILRELLEAGQGWVSGSALAERLGMSRVGVWSYMEKLRQSGFAFEAQRARGYRLKSQPAELHPALIQAYLSHKSPPFFWLEETESTNSEAERLLAAGAADPVVVLARRQTRGRGRFGRVWHSVHEGNLYLSFGFRPRLDPMRMQTFTLWMGVSVCECLANVCRVSPRLKWPNDLLLDDRKAGGMLTEARVDADQIHDLVFGLGLNVNMPAAAFPPGLAWLATSLSIAAGAPIDHNRLTAALIGRVLTAYEAFVAGETEREFHQLWERYDLLRGQTVGVIQAGETTRGVAEGIDREGALQVRRGNGQLAKFRAGEVTLEKSPVF